MMEGGTLRCEKQDRKTCTQTAFTVTDKGQLRDFEVQNGEKIKDFEVQPWVKSFIKKFECIGNWVNYISHLI